MQIVPRVNRLKRFRVRFRSRTQNYDGLQKAGSQAETIAWAEQQTLELFNGNALRARLVWELARLAHVSHFIETGTSHAATAIGAHRLLGLPVWSCEVSRRDHWISRAVSFGLPGIVLYNLDSREFLRRVVPQLLASKANPIFYLDAHEGGTDLASLPLRDELELILRLNQFIVVIDDFRVPHRDDFRWGVYGEQAIDLTFVRETLLSSGITQSYFPQYAVAAETGYPAGYMLFWRSTILDRAVSAGGFPVCLLSTCALESPGTMPQKSQRSRI